MIFFKILIGVVTIFFVIWTMFGWFEKINFIESEDSFDSFPIIRSVITIILVSVSANLKLLKL